MKIPMPIRELTAAVLAALLAGTIHAATPEEAATSLVRESLDSAIEVLRNGSLPDDEKRARIEEIAYDRFDFATMSRLVLARNWKRFNREQRTAFLAEFKLHLSVTYGKTLLNYKDEEITIKDSRAERNGDVTVRTEVRGSSVEPILISYRLRNRNESWRVIDVIVEGVSLISNFRSQTQEIISSSGPDGLIEMLREKNAKGQEEG